MSWGLRTDLLTAPTFTQPSEPRARNPRACLVPVTAGLGSGIHLLQQRHEAVLPVVVLVLCKVKGIPNRGCGGVVIHRGKRKAAVNLQQPDAERPTGVRID